MRDIGVTEDIGDIGDPGVIRLIWDIGCKWY